MSLSSIRPSNEYLVPHGSSDAIQLEHRVIVLGNGNIVFFWVERVEVDYPYFHDSIRYRVFTPEGVAITEELQANTFSNGNQVFPVVTALPDGGFLAVWQSYGQDSALGRALYGRRCDENGSPLGDEFRLTDPVDGQVRDQTIEVLADGGWVVSWHRTSDRDPDDGLDNFEFFHARFDAAGQAVTAPEPVSETTAGVSRDGVQMQALPDGGWVTVWTEHDMKGKTTGGIYQTRFDAAGEPVVVKELVSVEPASAEPDHIGRKRGDPQITLLADGGWIVV